MHLKRLLSAALLLPLFYLFVMRLSPAYFAALLSFIAALALSEFYSMYGTRGALRFAGIVLGAMVPVAAHLYGGVSGVLIIPFMAILAVRLFFKSDPASALSDIAAVAVGLFYIAGLLSYQVGLRGYGPEWIIFLYGSVWGSDSLAYYIGKGIGKRKLYQKVSPNKTVAGAFGSVLGGLVSALLLGALLIPALPLDRTAFLGAVVGAATIAGDLVESMFKRDAGVKDSGSLIPGHGGILDKIDGIVFTGPLLYWLKRVIGE